MLLVLLVTWIHLQGKTPCLKKYITFVSAAIIRYRRVQAALQEGMTHDGCKT